MIRDYSCVIAAIRRDCQHWLEGAVTIDEMGPNIETIHRGVFGDHRDTGLLYVMLEAPRLGFEDSARVLWWEGIYENIAHILYAGHGTIPSDVTPAPLNVFRPTPTSISTHQQVYIPQRNISTSELIASFEHQQQNWQWSLHATAQAYRDTIQLYVESVHQWLS